NSSSGPVRRSGGHEAGAVAAGRGRRHPRLLDAMLTALSTLAALAFCALFASLNARGRARAERRAAAALGDAHAERSRVAAVLEGARAVVLPFGRDGKLVACNAEAQELLAALGRTARIFDLSADESWHAAARGALDGRPARFDQTFVVGGEARHF